MSLMMGITCEIHQGWHHAAAAEGETAGGVHTGHQHGVRGILQIQLVHCTTPGRPLPRPFQLPPLHCIRHRTCHAARGLGVQDGGGDSHERTAQVASGKAPERAVLVRAYVELLSALHRSETCSSARWLYLHRQGHRN